MYFCFDGDSFDMFNTKDEAASAAEDALDDYRATAEDGWDEASMNVCWGVVLGTTRVVFQEGRDGDEERFIHSHNEYRCGICGGVVRYDSTTPGENP